MNPLIATHTCIFALLASAMVIAEEPQKNPDTGRDQPAATSPSAPILPDQTETPRMKAWCDMHYGLFLHFNMNTYGEGQHPGALPVAAYQPVKLDVDSWLRMAKDGGMKYAVLTAKHDSGFCLWDSKVPWHGKEFEYDVAASQYQTDVVQAFMDACKKHGIVPGLYYGLQDFYAGNGRKPGPLPQDYFELVKGHLAEMTTRYPDCHYYWIDNPSKASREQVAAMYDQLRRADPRNVVQFNAHLAKPWGDESANDPGLEPGRDAAADGPGTQVFEKSHGFGFPTDVIGSENRKPNGPVPKLQSWQGKQYFVGYEHCTTLGGSWFKSEKFPSSTRGVFADYQKIRNYGGNLLLDLGPDRQGQIDERYAKLLIELKAQIDPFEAALAKKNK